VFRELIDSQRSFNDKTGLSMIGTRLAHYVITEHLGTGGMGEVFQATDSKLGRSVALKLLPEAFAQDQDRVARFEREARVLASLNHPHIAAIFGLEESDGRKFLVMELVRGETLAARIARGPLPSDEATKIAMQIAEALEAAHESGVVHRDLKPANIKIAPDGSVKVLDFGLAKAYAVDASNVTLSESPTLSAAATRAGVILGTAAYMSPEQAKGRAVDQKTDIWSFGCVLYEMVTGQRAFAGADVPETLAAVIAKDPDWTALTASAPPSIQKLVRRCLAKDAKKRLAHAGDVRLELDESQSSGLATLSGPVVSSPANPVPRYLKLALLTLLLATAGLIASQFLKGEPPTVGDFRASIFLPPGVLLYGTHIALSPGGKYLAFVASGTAGRGVWVREINSLDARPLPGAERAITVFWSPDSQHVAFFADGKLKRVAVAGGGVLTVCDCPGEFGSWSAEDVILFVPRVYSALFRVPATGGTPTPATTLDAAAGETSHSSPVFLPNGRHFLYHVEGRSSPPATYVGELDSTERIRLIEGENLGACVQFAQEHLVYSRDETLVAHSFDTNRLRVRGEPSPIAEHVRIQKNFWYGRLPTFTVSQTGLLVLQHGQLMSRLEWFDRSGTPAGQLTEKREYVGDLELSPDRKRLAVSVANDRRSHIWFVNVPSGALTQFTFGSGDELGLRWSADGRRAIYRSVRPQVQGGAYGLYQKSTDGGGSEELVLQSERPLYPDGWSRDEKTMFYEEDDPKLAWGLWQMSLPDRKASPFLQIEDRQEYNRTSPDGRWVAYQSTETGVYEVFVTTFPKSDAKWRVSTAGGSFHLRSGNARAAAPSQTHA
jgi:serine/threonine protein kinase/Tol biopolymer transport system component